MSKLNSRKLLGTFIAVFILCVIIGIWGVIAVRDQWYWIIGSLFIGFLITGGPLLRAYVESRKQEELDLPEDSDRVACKKCGYEVPSGVLYCDNCGQKVDI